MDDFWYHTKILQSLWIMAEIIEVSLTEMGQLQCKSQTEYMLMNMTKLREE